MEKNHVKQKVKKTIIFLRLRIITEAISYQMKKHCSLLLIFFSQNDELLSPRDMFTSSVFALLLCCPSRISEIFSLTC